jgi:hypothetical protein
MKLINDIINELIDTEKSISSPLLKTKVLASRLQNANLLNWVSNELKGYSKEKELPEYRKHRGTITGCYINGTMQYNNQPIVTIGLSNESLENLHSMNFSQSISTLESLKKGKKSSTLEHSFSAEWVSIIQSNWRKRGAPYLQLINCKTSIAVNSVDEILAFVRNNLLDFMLQIDAEFGNITEIEELKTKQSEITTIMKQTIINTTGDGNVLNTGDKAEINATINISKGNKEELSKHLNEMGISETDSSELLKIIDTEEPNKENQTFGKKVNTWTQTMLGKALDGTWNIGIGAAGNLIADAVKSYYGM